MALIQPKTGPLCAKCPLYTKGIAVHDRMPPETRWTGLSLVGEMPGKNEVQQSLVFVGESGRHIEDVRKWIQRPDTHVTNAIRCGLPRGMKPSITDAYEAARCCKPTVVENMRYLGTTCSLHLGALSMYTYMGLGGYDKKQGFSGIETYRGVVLPPGDYETWPATCTLHPAGIIREEAGFIKVSFLAADLEKAHGLAEGSVDLWKPNIRDAAKVDDLCAWLIEIRKDAVATKRPVALDVETWGATSKDARDPLLCTLRTIGVGYDGVGYSIPHIDFYRFYDRSAWRRICRLLRRILMDPRVETEWHNKVFDIPIMEKWFECEITGTRHDTMQAHQVCFPRLKHDLQNVASQFLAVHPWKSDFKKVGNKKVSVWTAQDETWEEFLELMYYNACDALATWEAGRILRQKQIELNVTAAYENDLEVLDMAIDWYRNGVPIDRDMLRKLEHEERLALRDGLIDLQRKVAEDVQDPEVLGIEGFIGPEIWDLQHKKGFNPRSSIQLRKYLFDVLGLIPVRYTEKTQKPSVAKEALWEMRGQTPYLEQHFKWKKRDHDYSLYLKGLEPKLHPDGRLRVTWKKQVIPSGRFSSSPNIQNFVKDMLKMLIAPEGYVVLGADYDQLEIRVAAALAVETELIELLLRECTDKLDPEQDVHSRNGRMYYKEIWDKLAVEGDREALDVLRTHGKPVTFLMQYMGSDEACYEAMKEWRPDDDEADLRREASLCRARWLLGHPAIVRAADRYHEMANKQRYLRTFLLGRVLRWPMGNASPTDSANFPIQGGARDLMDLGLRRWRKALEEAGSYQTIVFPNIDVHDAIFAFCKAEHAEEERERMQASLACELDITSPITGEVVPMKFPAEAKIGNNVKEVK